MAKEVENKWFLRVHETTDKDIDDRFRTFYLLDEDYAKNLPQHIDLMMEEHYKHYPTQDFFTKYFCADGLSEYKDEEELLQKAVIDKHQAQENYHVLKYIHIGDNSFNIQTKEVLDDGGEDICEYRIDVFRGGFEEFLEYYTENEITVPYVAEIEEEE